MKPEYQEETHKDRGRTCKLHTQRVENQPPNPEVVQPTEQPHHPLGKTYGIEPDVRLSQTGCWAYDQKVISLNPMISRAISPSDPRAEPSRNTFYIQVLQGLADPPWLLEDAQLLLHKKKSKEGVCLSNKSTTGVHIPRIWRTVYI